MHEDVTYKMTLSMNVLNHLGINLYSNLPAVLSEAVANAWDADATRVEITIDPAAETVTIVDNGLGMTPREINERYLRVGYERRKDKDNPTGARTAKGRAVMGRKGIGKLSLFSIAKVIEVRSAAIRPGDDAASELQQAALRLDLDDMTEQISADVDSTYLPEPLEIDDTLTAPGTAIMLRKPRKDLRRTAAHLRRRLARRFSMTTTDFEIVVDGEPITPADRDLAKRSRYLWVFGPEEYVKEMKRLVPGAERTIPHPGITPGGHQVTGWIGAAATSSDLKPTEADDESLNRIAVLVRGKLAQEDALEAAAQGGLFTRFLSGEINADYLDDDSQADIATSSRQGIVEDDPRFEDFRAFLTARIGAIGTEWNKFREEDGARDAARVVPAVQEWLDTLKGDKKAAAKSFIGKINASAMDQRSQKRLLSSGIIAFEQLQRTERLSVIEAADEANLPALIEAFASIDDVEAAMYYDIVKQRVAIIDKFEDLTDDNSLERVLQEYLFEHLWLLDPGWDRATLPHKEKTIAKLIGSGDQQDRVDIKYRTTGSAHVIVELKRAGRLVTSLELLNQIEKYRSPVLKQLRQAYGEGVELQVVCVLGREPSDWSDPDGRKRSRELMDAVNGRIVLYQELVANAHEAYSQYLEANRQVGQVRDILAKLEVEVDGD